MPDLSRPTFDHIERLAKKRKSRPVAVASAHDPEVLEAILDARKQYKIEAILFGDTEQMRLLAPDIETIKGITLVETADDEQSAALAVEACKDGSASILMKGNLPTSTFMRAVVNKETGLRQGKLLSHVMFYEVEAYGKLLGLTDGGLNTFPDRLAKIEILENALTLMKTFGYERINVSLIAGAEQINPKIMSTVDAAEISALDKWQTLDANVIGPVGLDLAVSVDAVKAKHYSGYGAGSADLLVVPTYEVGNGIGKTLTYFANAKSAGLVVGASVPIVLVSRADDSEAKRLSIALGLVAAGA
ncbi:MAG TPA: phosphate butyryltransferase [Fastidiosipila sp.]|nr:phosphate butyryltransferase [Fastidiosipila sp.]